MDTVINLSKMFLVLASCVAWFVLIGCVVLSPKGTWNALTWLSYRNHGKYADISNSIAVWSILLVALFWSSALMWIW